jgi:DNA replication and repair protein RecF
MLLDDVMSELDQVRRQALVELLRAAGAQAVITTTDLDHVPGARESAAARVEVQGGNVLTEAMV